MRRPAKFHVDSSVRFWAIANIREGGGVKRPPPVKRGLKPLSGVIKLTLPIETPVIHVQGGFKVPMETGRNLEHTTERRQRGFKVPMETGSMTIVPHDFFLGWLRVWLGFERCNSVLVWVNLTQENISFSLRRRTRKWWKGIFLQTNGQGQLFLAPTNLHRSAILDNFVNKIVTAIWI